MQTVLVAGQVYLWAGIAVAVVFPGGGLDRIEPKGRGAWMFRRLLVPGVVLIWPLVLLAAAVLMLSLAEVLLARLLPGEADGHDEARCVVRAETIRLRLTDV